MKRSGEAELEAVRRPRLLRFRDDVTVWAEDHEGRTRAEFGSAPGISRGDLGQKPRNPQESIRNLERELPAG